MHSIVSDALAGISLTCWLILMIPQIRTSYLLKRPPTISFPFLCCWLFGDTINLIGAIIQHLLPSTIILFIYFILSDVLVLGQFFWYLENEIIANIPIYDTVEIVPKEIFKAKFRKYIISIVLVLIFTVILILLLQNSFIFSLFLQSNVLGWLSNGFFWLARLFQLKSNFFKTKKEMEDFDCSTFIICFAGNVTFIMSILMFPEADSAYLWANFPWIIGNLITMVLDAFISIQVCFIRNFGNDIEREPLLV